MDRRFFLTAMGAGAAAFALLRSGPSEAMPLAPNPAVPASDAAAPAVATDVDVENARPEEARYGFYRRRRFRRRFFRRRYFRRRYFRPRFVRRRYFRPRFFRRRYFY